MPHISLHSLQTRHRSLLITMRVHVVMFCDLGSSVGAMSMGGIHGWGTTFGCLTEKEFFKDNFICLVCLDLYCEAYFGSYLHFILHIEYTDKVNLEGVGSFKISF